MADKQHGPKSISLYSKTAVEILSRTDLTLFHHNESSVQSGNESIINHPAAPGLTSSTSLSEQLIPLDSVSELLTYHKDGEPDEDIQDSMLAWFIYTVLSYKASQSYLVV